MTEPASGRSLDRATRDQSQRIVERALVSVVVDAQRWVSVAWAILGVAQLLSMNGILVGVLNLMWSAIDREFCLGIGGMTLGPRKISLRRMLIKAQLILNLLLVGLSGRFIPFLPAPLWHALTWLFSAVAMILILLEYDICKEISSNAWLFGSRDVTKTTAKKRRVVDHHSGAFARKAIVVYNTLR